MIRHQGFRWIKLSVLLFMLAAIAGLLASLIVSLPIRSNLFLFTFQEFRPLHTFLSLMGLVAGSIGMINLILLSQVPHLRAPGNEEKLKSGGSIQLFTLFLLIGTVLLLAGVSTGREYFSWYPLLTILLLIVLVSQGQSLVSHTKKLIAASPEGFWLVGLGLGFVVAGLIESQFWLIPFVGDDLVRDLTVQWHGIDTFIAGTNALMYGAAVFIVQKKPKPLRKRWLYFLAGFSILFTFGHHHYVSPQPHYLKILAFLASMVAIVSFIRHLRAHKSFTADSRSPRTLLVRSVELWTLVSVGSGVLFAIPQVNLIVHGTYFIVIHAMGSMIGVNLLLVFLAGVHYSKPLTPKDRRRMVQSVKGINYSLVALWVVLGGSGLIKGVMRLDSTYWEMMEWVSSLLYLFPVVGLVLTASIITGSLVLFSVTPREFPSPEEAPQPADESRQEEPVLVDG